MAEQLRFQWIFRDEVPGRKRQAQRFWVSCGCDCCLMQPHYVEPVADAQLLGSAVVGPLSQLIQRQAAIVRVAHGSVLPLGLGALLRAVEEAGRTCSAHRSLLHTEPQGIDLWNAEIARPRTFSYLTKALHDGGLDRLRLIRLCEIGLKDNHVAEIACALSQHPSLEILSVSNNHITASSGISLFNTFVSLKHARALDISLNPLGDLMAEAIAGRLSSGVSWNLQALWFAYCSVSNTGLKDIARIIRAGANNLEHLVLSGQKDSCEGWESVSESCLETAVKLRVLPDYVDASQLSVHIMDEMSQVAVNGKCNSDTLAAAFMSYYRQFTRQKESDELCHQSAVQETCETAQCSVLDDAWQSAMSIMSAIRS